jgi:hypothetical protein
VTRCSLHGSQAAMKNGLAAPELRRDAHDCIMVSTHACRMALEGIVSKRRDSSYRSGRSRDWLKSKNPASAAVKREAEEDRGS